MRSMRFPAYEGATVERHEIVGEAIRNIVTVMTAEDSEAKDELDGGGLRTITFAAGHAHDLGDLNPNNLAAKWQRIHWQVRRKVH